MRLYNELAASNETAVCRPRIGWQSQSAVRAGQEGTGHGRTGRSRRTARSSCRRKSRSAASCSGSIPISARQFMEVAQRRRAVGEVASGIDVRVASAASAAADSRSVPLARRRDRACLRASRTTKRAELADCQLGPRRLHQDGLGHAIGTLPTCSKPVAAASPQLLHPALQPLLQARRWPGCKTASLAATVVAPPQPLPAGTEMVFWTILQTLTSTSFWTGAARRRCR